LRNTAIIMAVSCVTLLGAASDSLPRDAPCPAVVAFAVPDSMHQHALLWISLSDGSEARCIDTVATVPADSNCCQPSTAMTPDGYLQVGWCAGGRVYYTGSRVPVFGGVSSSSDSSLWFPLMLVSPRQCEPAMGCTIEAEGAIIRITWQSRSVAPGEKVETWTRFGHLRPGRLPAWDAIPLCVASPAHEVSPAQGMRP
jgi:hypothetical protein